MLDLLINFTPMKESVRKKIEETLNIMDKARRVKGNPYLHTRIMEKVREREGLGEKQRVRRPVPVFQLAAVSLLVFLNIAFVWGQLQDYRKEKQASFEEGLAREYGLGFDDPELYYPEM
jgi:hypothetical protein